MTVVLSASFLAFVDNVPAKSNLRTLQDALQAVHKMSQNEKLSSEKASLKDSKSVSATTVLSKSLTVQSVKPGEKAKVFQSSPPQLSPYQDSTTQPHSSAIKAKSAGKLISKTKNLIQGHPSQPIESVGTEDVNMKRGFSKRESSLRPVNSNTRETLPRPQQYDDMGGAVRNPLEDGTYFTPAKSTDKFEYFAEHYSPDPYVAAAQRQEWMTVNTGNGVSPNPQLSRKSKRPKVKQARMKPSW